MLRCKHCNGSDFGVTVTETTVKAFREINGEVKEQLGEPQKQEEKKIGYCFTCMKEITEKDLTEIESCSICGREYDTLIDGKCESCNEHAKKLASMSKEDLILMMLQGNLPDLKNQNKKEVIEKQKKDEKKESKAKVSKKEVKDEKPNVVSTNDTIEIPNKEKEENLSRIDSEEKLENIETVKIDINDSMPICEIDENDILSQLDAVDVLDLSELDIIPESIEEQI